MEIKTKFNIGDTVYIFRHESIFVTEIKDIKILCYYNGEYHVDYTLFDKSYELGVTICEDKIFATEEECRKSIPILTIPHTVRK